MAEQRVNRIMDLEDEYRLISENLVDAVWTIDVHTQSFEYITPSIEKVSGYPQEEYIGATLAERLTPASYLKVSTVLNEEIKNFKGGEKNIRTLEVELVHKTGKTYWGEIRARLMRGTDNRLKVIGVTREIDAQKQAEFCQNELIQRLGKALDEKEQLLKEIKTLQGLLPICSGCSRIRDEQGRWWPIEAYVSQKTEAEFSHSICTDCMAIFYSDG